jgi:TfoX/Sxy family transcriptional regulator of competence genes
MASDRDFVDFVVDQIENAGEITAKSMFGEYGIFSGDKIFALICDNKLFIKPTESGRLFIKELVEAPPYPGAKPCFLIEDKLEDRDWLSNLVRITVKELPEPKPKKRRSKKRNKLKE